MGRTGINNHTIGMFSLLSAMGIDKTVVSKNVAETYEIGDGKKDLKMSFGNLLFSQSIVKEYTDLLELKSSNTTDVNPMSNTEILTTMISELEDKLIKEGYLDYAEDEDSNNVFDKLTGDNLVINIADPSNSDPVVDLHVLKLLSLLMEYQPDIRDMQKVLNMSSNGMGLDLIEANNNLTILNRALNSGKLDNFSKLLFKELPESAEDKIIKIRGLRAVVPNTPIGASIINSYEAIQSLWSGFYPYESENYKDSVEMALS